MDDIEWARHFWVDVQGFPEERAVEVMTGVLFARRHMVDSMEKDLAPLGLTVTRYLTQVTILCSEHEARRVGDLSKRMMLHPTTMTSVVDQLENDGLVNRERHPTDRRATLVALTPSGRTLTREASRLLAQQKFGLPVLRNPEIEQLASLLNTLRRRLRP